MDATAVEVAVAAVARKSHQDDPDKKEFRWQNNSQQFLLLDRYKNKYYGIILYLSKQAAVRDTH